MIIRKTNIKTERPLGWKNSAMRRDAEMLPDNLSANKYKYVHYARCEASQSGIYFLSDFSRLVPRRVTFPIPWTQGRSKFLIFDRFQWLLRIWLWRKCGAVLWSVLQFILHFQAPSCLTVLLHAVPLYQLSGRSD